MSDIKTVLQEFVATYNDPKVSGDLNKTLGYFPELKGYDAKVLEEYVLTANDNKVAGDWDKVNSYFPELFKQKINIDFTPKFDKKQEQPLTPLQPQAPKYALTPEIEKILPDVREKQVSPMPNFFQKNSRSRTSGNTYSCKYYKTP